ncbi:hypothetical protein WN48_06731 [Eufriesea mexicana]|uniref:CHK kinase-like domain-containing protein n=1 Tax=Eufriesea mexicana TaxID=516756 RepID=A0A310SS46_9HYME|nr:PREDICTED: uncharacterized protein LOC108545541 [Eufriesea mexicana]OAD59966.1 hypothetical protein WN48_06731 [Eufriesea mexicana]
MATISADPACCLTDSAKSQLSAVREKPAPLLLDSDINKIAERKLRSNNFRVLHWSLDSLGETNGFMGQYYTLSVRVKIDDKSKHLKFFAKTPPSTSSPQYDFLSRHDIFNKEITIYRDVVPKMGVGHATKWLPDYYLGKKSTIIVLEDATESGYVTLDKYQSFDEEHSTLLVKTLSTFHSRSLILDEKLRRSTGQTIMDLYGDLLREVGYVKDDVTVHKYSSASIKGAAAIVDFTEGLKDDEANAIKDWITKWVPKLPTLLEPSSKFRNLMCHRDVWSNNMMFKRDSAGKPVGCYLVDFQFLRYSPPAFDFVACLLLTLDRATRRRCYDRLVDVYYDTMRKELAADGLSVDDCLSRDQFVDSCEHVKGVALLYVIANLQIMLLSKEAVEEYFIQSPKLLEHVLYGDERPDLVRNQCRARKEYQQRQTEIIEEIREYLAGNPWLR